MNEAEESTEEAHFRKHIFYIVLDNVIGALTFRFCAAKQISDTLSFLWNCQKMSKEQLMHKAAKIVEKYSKDISRENLVQEMNHIAMVHDGYLGRRQLGAFELLNALAEYILENIFSNLRVSLRISPVTVASIERSFSKLRLITNYLRSTMDQDRLSNMAGLVVESDIAKKNRL